MRRRLWARLHSSKKHLLMALLALMTGVEFLENLMYVFSATHIMGGIGASPREFALTQAAYAIGSMTMIVKQQWLAARYGYRRYLTVALAIFSAGTLACAHSESLSMLVASRFVQGVGGGALFTSSRILVNLLFAARERGQAIRYFMIGVFGASALAPALAGELMEHGTWQMVFYGVLPFSLLAMLGAATLLPAAEPRDDEAAWEIAPLLLFAGAIVVLQVSISELSYDIFAYPAQLFGLGLLGFGLLFAFLWHQWHHPTPLLRLRMLHDPTYLTGLALYFLYYTLTNFAGYLFPVFAEQALGVPLRVAGWLNSFAGAVSLGAILVYLKLAARFPRKRPLMVCGALTMVCTALWYSTLPPDATLMHLALGLIPKGLFGVLLVIPIAGLTFRGLGDDGFPHGYQSKNLVRQLAVSSSSAVAAVLLHNRQFAVHSQLLSHVQADNPSLALWMSDAQRALMAQGLDAGAAMHGAMAQLALLADRQSLLIACGDMYRLLAALALATAIVVWVQRKLP
ncbi:MAG: MFS transporter [Rhodocyclaceae bacterium]